MFTSRAEHRLLLRQDNADLRLSDLGHSIGLLPDQHHRRVVTKRAAIQAELERLRTQFQDGDTLEQILRRPEMTYADLPHRRTELSSEVTTQVEIAVKYHGYIQRQEVEVARAKGLEDAHIPAHIEFQAITGLGTEARAKLSKIRPLTVGQAARISGVSPADISIILVHLKRWRSSSSSSSSSSGSSPPAV